MMKILGIESSCDETAASVVCDETVPANRILSSVIRSQTEVHAPYGGVVPELSSRAHIDVIEPIIGQALQEAGTTLDEIDAIAVTAGPGLIGGVIVGVMMAKGMAAALGKPLIGVNHLEGHALTARMTHDVEFPYLLLLISGGHCQILVAHDVGNYRLLGQTLDDALGEAFDKTAKMLGLPYPGGPQVEQLARQGDPQRFDFPRPLLDRNNCDFSFSGLKTAVARLIEKEKDAAQDREQLKRDICASFQRTAGDILVDRMSRAAERAPGAGTLVIAGGVAANTYLKQRLDEVGKGYGLEVIAPPLNLCTDNAAMIAWAGLEKFRRGEVSDLSLKPRARWGLAEAD